MVADGPDPERAARERAAYRAFVRDHHPDRGGDHDAFVAGLARLQHDPPTPGDPDPDADIDSWRYDAPVEIVHPLPLPTRVAVALIRTLRWHRQQRRVE